MKAAILAEKPGTTTHISALLKNAQRLGLDADGLERLAVRRGCTYYHNGEPLPALPVYESRFQWIRPHRTVS